MKNDKSIRVTQIAVRICYFLLGAAAILFPTLIDYSLHDFEVLSDIKMQALPPFYCVVPAGYTALVLPRQDCSPIAENQLFLIMKMSNF